MAETNIASRRDAGGGWNRIVLPTLRPDGTREEITASSSVCKAMVAKPRFQKKRARRSIPTGSVFAFDGWPRPTLRPDGTRDGAGIESRYQHCVLRRRGWGLESDSSTNIASRWDAGLLQFPIVDSNELANDTIDRGLRFASADVRHGEYGKSLFGSDPTVGEPHRVASRVVQHLASPRPPELHESGNIGFALGRSVQRLPGLRFYQSVFRFGIQVR